jgi:hypothetical protein
MTLTVELTEEQVAALELKALAEGLTLRDWARKKLTSQVSDSEERRKPYKSSYGILAKYGPGPSAEEIDENRREMFRGFGEDL